MEVDYVDTRTQNVISICSGIGGMELGLDAALAGRTRTICYIENEISVAAILAARMEDGSIDPAPIWTDLTTFDPEPWRGKVDILAGGFPCQPFSFAGKRLQSADERNLWPDVARIIDGIKPDRVFVENVSGILRYFHERIRRDLREMAYEVAEGLFTAAETGAPHKRERLFILAHAEEYGVQEPRPTNQPKGKHASTTPISNGEALAHADGLGHVHEQPGVEPDHRGLDAQRHAAEGGGELADTGGEGLQRVRFAQQGEYAPGRGDVPLYPPAPNDHAGWEWLLARWPELAPTYCKDGHDVQPEMSQIECEFCGSSDGPTQELPTEVLLRGIGNGVVPAVAALAFSTLSRVLRAG
jgi:DNA (cytosine-5)-methyltransferase 1